MLPWVAGGIAAVAASLALVVAAHGRAQPAALAVAPPAHVEDVVPAPPSAPVPEALTPLAADPETAPELPATVVASAAPAAADKAPVAPKPAASAPQRIMHHDTIVRDPGF